MGRTGVIGFESSRRRKREGIAHIAVHQITLHLLEEMRFQNFLVKKFSAVEYSVIFVIVLGIGNCTDVASTQQPTRMYGIQCCREPSVNSFCQGSINNVFHFCS